VHSVLQLCRIYAERRLKRTKRVCGAQNVPVSRLRGTLTDSTQVQYGGKPVEHVGPLAPTGPPPKARLPDVDEVRFVSISGAG